MSDVKLKWASRISAMVSVLVLCLKTLAYYQSHSQALLSDALESIVNVVASLVALWVVHISVQPADDEHPYGHGKAEYFSAAFEGGLISFAGIVIIAEAAHALLKSEPLPHLQEGLLYSGLATLANFLLAWYLYVISKKYKSDALKSSALHIFSDVWTTAGAAVGLFIVMLTGWIWLDSVTAIIMALFLLKSGAGVVRHSLGALMDETHPDTLKDLAAAFDKERYPGIIDIHQTRVLRSGRFHHVDAHIVIPEFWDVKETHLHTQAFEDRVIKAYPFDGELAFHVDPCLRNYCKNCDLSNCSFRKHNFENRKPITPESLVSVPPIIVHDEN